MLEALGQVGQETAVSGADFKGRGGWAEALFVEQRQHAVPILWHASDQVLLSSKFLGDTREKVLAGRCSLSMYGTDARLHVGGQGQVVDLFQQCSMQLAAQQFGVGQGTTIKNGIAFATRGHQLCLGQHLEVVAHA